MKTTNTLFKNRATMGVAFALFFASFTSMSFAQSKDNGDVRVKVVKIVDGDTTTIEKTLNQAKLEDFTI